MSRSTGCSAQKLSIQYSVSPRRFVSASALLCLFESPNTFLRCLFFDRLRSVSAQGGRAPSRRWAAGTRPPCDTPTHSFPGWGGRATRVSRLEKVSWWFFWKIWKSEKRYLIVSGGKKITMHEYRGLLKASAASPLPSPRLVERLQDILFTTKSWGWG